MLSVLGPTFLPGQSIFSQEVFGGGGDQAASLQAHDGARLSMGFAEERSTHNLATSKDSSSRIGLSYVSSYKDDNFSLARLTGYTKLLEIGRMRKHPLLLNIGVGSGNNVRQAVLDGYPGDSIIATDVSSELWTRAREQYGSVPGLNQVSFLAGEVLNSYFLEAVYPFYTAPSSPPPPLSTLTSLNPLHGQVSAVCACFVFHLLDESRQLQLARAIAGLLSPQPGSMVIGVQYARLQKGVDHAEPACEGTMFYHSPASWAELWNGQLFQKDTVEVFTRLVEVQNGGGEIMGSDGSQKWIMEWTVTRL